MTVYIAGGRIRDDNTGGVLYLAHEDGSDYASWPFHVNGEGGNMPGPNVWVWENPEEATRPHEVTLSPSLKYEGGIGPNFHIFIKNGEIEHCGDCKCGCKS